MPSGGPVCSPGRSEVIRESFYDSRTHGYLGTAESQDRQIISSPKSITESHSSLENPNFSLSLIERKSISSISNEKASTAEVVDNAKEKVAGRTSPEKRVVHHYPQMPEKTRRAQRDGWKRDGKTFLMVNKEGFQRKMNRAETNFFKECDRIEQEKATRRKEKNQVRERKNRKYQERQEKQDK